MTTTLDHGGPAAPSGAAPLGPPPGDHPESAEPGRPPAGPPPAPPAGDASPSRWSVRRISQSGWITAAIAGLTAVLYSWNLSVNGYGNEYYAAAVKSASLDWKAFFFGSIDPGNFITVDKPPAAIWVQALSVRIFGFSSLSMLLPEVLLGVASVLVLHRLVKRWMGNTAAHLAALGFALTPVALLMFRFNNPDALLTFLCLAAAWALWAALESGRTRGLVLSGALIGLAFQTKMLQAFVVLPAFILVYVVAGKPSFGKRIAQLAAALAALVVSCAWWIVIVAMWPASDRPYIGSTDDNSILSLLFGYNGFGRIFGNSGGGPGGGGPGAGGGNGFGGAVGWLRMFNSENVGQVAWLYPLAIAGLLGGLWLTRRSPRTDLRRAGWILWGTWMVVMTITFSKASGIFHSYYTVQLAPAIAACAGAGAIALWQLGRQNRWLRWVLPTAIVATAALAVGILGLTPTYHPWLRTAIIAGATLAAVGLWLGGRLKQKPLVLAAAAIATLTLLAGPTAYALTTVNQSASGSIVAAGPTSNDRGLPGGSGGLGTADDGAPGNNADGGATNPADGGGGPGRGQTADAALVAYLEANQGDATYLVAAFSSMSSSSIIIESGKPVITIGGFSGSDPAPTLEQFTELVRTGQVRYVLVGGGGPGGMGGGPGGRGSNSSISSWVTQNGTVVDAATYGGTGTGGTLYDVSGAA